ncbi:MAG: class II aldolase/adducin family protein [Pontiellaceae bacterium]|jgi:ribulose-5-phosphate 4-epimerase/fuculose-1-phosphate aldolase|nr:class II aldolase/adducin family protein [Pontiellaceae bacterium]
MTEGYVKFTAHLTDGDIPETPELRRLNEVRTALHDLGMIGVLPDGVGYGNVSVRLNETAQFIISGTATGAKRILTLTDYCRVDSFDIRRNEVFCTGRIQASSESMSHGSVYRANPAVRCVIHIHHSGLFRFMLTNGYPQTSAQTAYGTPQLAEETMQRVRDAGSAQGLIVMAGHEDGIIAYGADIETACQLLLKISDALSQVRSEISSSETPRNVATARAT